MVVDMKLHKNKTSVGSGKPLEVDRYEVIEQWEDYGYYQPSHAERYHRAPGVLRIGYPNALVLDDGNVLVVYDYGMGIFGNKSGVKQRIIPASWFLK